MVGRYPDNLRMVNSVLEWLNVAMSDENLWKCNNLHVDEVKGLETIKSKEWLETSLELLNSLTAVNLNNHLLFLHIELSYSKENSEIKELSLNWLKKNIDDYTPPSFNCTTIDYYDNFYKKELVKCHPTDDLLQLVDNSKQISFFYRIYFDKEEKMYSREIYVIIGV